MKKYILVLFTTGITFIAFPQITTTYPQYPTQNDSIVIYFDAAQTGGEELLNYTGTVYAHTGVNTNFGSWQHVIGTWGNNTTQPSLDRLGLNLYKLTIGRPRQFYNVTNPAENITALALVFRSSDGTKQTRPDIFTNLYLPGITVLVNNPNISNNFGDPLRSPTFASLDDTVHISVSVVELGTLVSNITLYVNNVQVAQTISNMIEYDFIAAQNLQEVNRISVVARDTAILKDSTEFIIFVNPLVQDVSLPLGKAYGINYDNSTTVTLALLAPHKKFIYVLGDFNDWKVNSSYYMKRDIIDSSKVIWWLTISGLTPGEEYAFQYYVDGNIRIADPYTEKILDSSNDSFISSTTYPNLKPYPTGKTSQLVSVLQTDQAPYPWQINFQRPAKTDLVIYELLLRDFLTSHDYKTLHDTLNYLKNLGVNIIELMPVNEFEGNESWGYNPSFHVAVDKYYGPKNDLKKFIDKAHEMGIAVILDVVLNHAFGQSPLVRLYSTSEGWPSDQNPWLNPDFDPTWPGYQARHPYNVGYDFNHESQATKDYVDRVTNFWMTEYKVDGFRFDLTKGFSQRSSYISNGNYNEGLTSSFDQTRINILKRMADKIWLIDPTFYVILEHFADNSEEIVLSNYGMMIWGNMNNQYNEATMGYSSNLIGGYYQSRGWTYPHLIAYMESHDEERLMYKNLTYGNSSGSYNIKDIREAINRIKLAAAFYFTIPGPKMIWQFGELGYDYSINYNGRLGKKPIRWDYFSDSRRLKLYKVFAELIKMKKNYEVFRTGNYNVALSEYDKKINITHPTMDVAVIGNFNVITSSFSPSFSRTGKWYEFFSGDSIDVTNVNMQMTFQPGDLRIYTTSKLPTPELDLLTETESDLSQIVSSNFELYQNYPNPFNPSTRIRYLLSSNSHVSLNVYDILGNEVATLVDEDKPVGSYEVEFKSSVGSLQLASGIYFYQLKAGSFVETKKMILLR